ncbi:phage tail protein [Escherichia coli]|nr:phage tail protein [Escherichia coli]
MSTIITEQYEHWCANQIISGKPARPDTFVFAYIPGQDESAEIPRDEILPDESMIQYRALSHPVRPPVAERDRVFHHSGHDSRRLRIQLDRSAERRKWRALHDCTHTSSAKN